MFCCGQSRDTHRLYKALQHGHHLWVLLYDGADGGKDLFNSLEELWLPRVTSLDLMT